MKALSLFARKCSRPKAALTQPHTRSASFLAEIGRQLPGLWLKQLGEWWVPITEQRKTCKKTIGGRNKEERQSLSRSSSSLATLYSPSTLTTLYPPPLTTFYSPFLLHRLLLPPPPLP